MKVKLLKKTRKKVKVYQRNRSYFVDIGSLIAEFTNIDDALKYYRFWIIEKARNKFGFKPKHRIK